MQMLTQRTLFVSQNADPVYPFCVARDGKKVRGSAFCEACCTSSELSWWGIGRRGNRMLLGMGDLSVWLLYSTSVGILPYKSRPKNFSLGS